MKLLVVAHPDDEIIWFNPGLFDRIIITFNHCHDKPWIYEARNKAIAEHPLNNRIDFFQLPESGFWLNRSRRFHHLYNFHCLKLLLRDYFACFKITDVFTHNALGEYGHSDHILVHDAVKYMTYEYATIAMWAPVYDDIELDSNTVCVIKTDYSLYSETKKIYERYDAWTWDARYLPIPEQRYQLINPP